MSYDAIGELLGISEAAVGQRISRARQRLIKAFRGRAIVRGLVLFPYVVPDDVALIGIGDSGTAELLDPALTTVRLPAAEMGTRAADKLLTLLAGDTPDNVRDVLDAELVIRKSCGCQR